jgi:iron complex outermembrane recepter protein
MWSRILGACGVIALCSIGMAEAQTPPIAVPADSDSPTGLTQVVVTGSRIQRNGFEAPTPVSVVGADRADELGTTNLGQLMNQLPSFRPTQTPASQSSTAGYVGGNVLDLRGLGSQRTLVLVDGERFVPSTTIGTVDTNFIPSILLDRAEVVTGGASAQYGSDAVAGVVNFILNDKLEGIKSQISYGQSSRADSRDTTAAFAGGMGLMDNRMHVIGAFEFEKNKGVEDCTTRLWCAEDWLNFGRTPALGTTIPANNILPNIHPSTIALGGVINSSVYAAGVAPPATDPLHGITFNPDTTPRAFDYGSLVNSLYMVGGEGGSHDAYFSGIPLEAPIDRYNLYTRAKFEINDKTEASLDVSYGHLEGWTTGAVDRNTALSISATNPYIPTSTNPAFNIPAIIAANGITSFNLGKDFTNLGNPQTVGTDRVLRIVPAFKGEIAGSWGWDAYYQFGKNKLGLDTGDAVLNANLSNAVNAVRQANGTIVCAKNANGANGAPGCVPYDVFGQTVAPGVQQYVTGNAFQTTLTTEHVVAANVHGNVVEGWAGPLAIASGAEFRSDQLTGATDPISEDLGFFTGNGSDISGRITATEGYVEADMPLAKDLFAAKSIDLNGAVRETHYDRNGAGASSSVNANTWKLGVVWELVDALRFRATRSQDIRAPNLSELFGPKTTGFGILNDPAHNGLQTNPVVISGSNPTLVPEVADTKTAGFVIRPTIDGFLGRTQFSLDYFDIDIKDAIGTLGAQTIATRCYEGASEDCDLITRNAAGTITQIEDVQQNVNELITRGVDLELDYRQSLGGYGKMDSRILGTYYSDLITVDSAGSVDQAGQTGLRAGTIPGVPRYTLDWLLNWSLDRWSADFHSRFIPAGLYNYAFIGPGEPGYSLVSPASSNTNHVKSALYLDFVGHYQILQNDHANLEIYAGMNNIANTDPPRVPGANGTGNNVLFDPIGRTWVLGLKYKEL